MATPTFTSQTLDMSWVKFSEQEDDSCQNPAKVCSKEPTWRITTSCCSFSFDFCNPCKERELEIEAHYNELDGGVDCKMCGARHIHLITTPLNK